jgi:osmotically-inducible protein OsmY
MNKTFTALLMSALLLCLDGCVLSVGSQADGSNIRVHPIDFSANIRLSQAVRARLDENPLTRDAKLSVHSDEGRVYLGGVTDNAAVLTEAVAIAMATPGVKGVCGGITILQKNTLADNAALTAPDAMHRTF